MPTCHVCKVACGTQKENTIIPVVFIIISFAYAQTAAKKQRQKKGELSKSA
jgi:hypothetical protein